MKIMVEQNIILKGDIYAEIVNSQGIVTKQINTNNLIVDLGLDRLTTLSGKSESTASGFVYTAVGIGTDAPAADDVSCLTESDRQTNTFTYGSTGVFYVSSSHTGLVATISEICLHNNDSASGGDPLGRATFSQYATLTAVDTLNTRYTISFANA